jgi:parvulin-like peptidyl-prolyl isomerase
MLSAFRLSRFGRLGRIVLAAGTLALVTAGVWGLRGVLVHRAAAQQAGQEAVQQPLVTTAAATTSDYDKRIVAYIHKSQPITRQDLGEYLIARYGAEKLPLMLTKRLLDKACADRHIVVTAAEVDAALSTDVKGMGVDQATFAKTILTKYKKNLYEWKEDILRPRLQMRRLVQERLTVSEVEIRKAYESTYGEKVECRLILWPLDKEPQAREDYNRLRTSDAAFEDMAKKQATSELASAGGRIRPIGRYTMDPKVEEAVFKLSPGELTEEIKTPQGIVLLKCDKRIPADTTIHFDSVKAKLAADIQEAKLQAEMASAFEALRKEGKPQPLLQPHERPEPGPVPPPNQVVAYLHGSEPVTREELGEFLIAHYGTEKIEFLVNRRIIEQECREKNITVTDAEIDATFKEDLAMMPGKVDKAVFQKQFLAKWGKNLFEWREDVLRPRLLLTKLCEGRVKCSDTELKQCFDAHYGERLECRMILWPNDQHRFALAEYSRIRDSEEEFIKKAKSQASTTLAAQGGRIPAFGRHAFGDERVEDEAFKMKPKEVSTLIGTPQGYLVLKLDNRIPPDTSVKLEKVRDDLTKEVLAKKLQMEMQVVFKDLHAKATPQVLIKGSGVPEDLAAQTKQLMSDLPPVPGSQPVK